MTKVVKIIKSSYTNILVMLFFTMVFFMRCANPSAPQGGDIDSLPPKIMEVNPPILTTNFTATEVEIVFDEYIQVKNGQSEILVSPEMKRKPRFVVKGKSLFINFEEKLDSATTYKIDFGLAIQDNNEGNPLVNFAYIFSTGDEIDSLAMSGQVVDAFSGDSIFNSLILLYDAKADSLVSDSVLFTSKPASVARTDSTGVFIATNLKPIDYKVYAISEESSNGKYEKGSDLVAFLDTTFNPAKLPPFQVWYNPSRGRIEATPQMRFRLFTEEGIARRQNMTKSSRPKKHQIYLEFAAKNPQISSITLDSVNMDSVIIERSKYNDTMTIFIPTYQGAIIPDTIKGAVTYASVTGDSIPKDTIVTKEFMYGFREIKKKKLKDGEKEPNPFFISARINNPLNPYHDILLEFDEPLSVVDSARIVLQKITTISKKPERGARGEVAKSKEEDSADEVIVEEADFELVPDTLSRLKWYLKSKWVPGTTYNLILEDSVFVDVISQKNDSISSKFNIMSGDKYGVVNITLEGRDTTSNYILMLVQGNRIIYQQKRVASDNVVFDYVASGEYELKIIKDDNFNLKWDEGDVVKRVLPELVSVYVDDKGHSMFEVKENWELNQTVDISLLSK